jgi:hypothetical protein
MLSLMWALSCAGCAPRLISQLMRCTPSTPCSLTPARRIEFRSAQRLCLCRHRKNSDQFSSSGLSPRSTRIQSTRAVTTGIAAAESPDGHDQTTSSKNNGAGEGRLSSTTRCLHGYVYAERWRDGSDDGQATVCRVTASVRILRSICIDQLRDSCLVLDSSFVTT